MSRLALLDELRASLDAMTRERDALRKLCVESLGFVNRSLEGFMWNENGNWIPASVFRNRLIAALDSIAPAAPAPEPPAVPPPFDRAAWEAFWHRCYVCNKNPCECPPDAAHAAADAGMYRDDGDYEE